MSCAGLYITNCKCCSQMVLKINIILFDFLLMESEAIFPPSSSSEKVESQFGILHNFVVIYKCAISNLLNNI